MTQSMATNKSLGDIYNGMKEGIIELKPDFQRKLVWNNAHKENFIETILKGYPFPEIYFCDGETDLNLMKTTKLVVDGQQRLSAIYRYIRGELLLKKIPPYESLDDVKKEDFLKYPIIVRDIGRINNEDIKDIFRRINSVDYALNATEVRHALYDGEFISMAKSISNKFSELIPIFGDATISRMKDIEFFLQIMVSVEMGGYFQTDDQVEELTKNYNDDYPNKELIYDNLSKVIHLIKNLELKRDSIWFRKSSLFTLIVELSIFGLQKGIFPKKESLRSELICFEKLIEENKNGEIEKNKYSMYYNYTYQGTNSKKGRSIRGEILREHLGKLE